MREGSGRPETCYSYADCLERAIDAYKKEIGSLREGNIRLRGENAKLRAVAEAAAEMIDAMDNCGADDEWSTSELRATLESMSS